MLSFFCINLLEKSGIDQEVESHEIEIQHVQEVKFLIMRSKFNLFMRSNFLSLFMRSKFPIMNILQKRSGDRIGPRGPRGSLFQVVFSNLT